MPRIDFGEAKDQLKFNGMRVIPNAWTTPVQAISQGRALLVEG